MSSPAASQNSSFAAALRKLAKQAMSPGAQTAPSIPPPTNTTLSPVKNKGCESPKLNGGTPVFKKEHTDTGFLNTKENRGHPNLPTVSGVMSPTIQGHQVVPGVFSLGPRGFESKSSPLEEHHGAAGHMQDMPRLRSVHPQSHPFYVPFLQRPPMTESVFMPSFHYYPPPMVDSPGLIPPGFDHETWRKRRAMEHLRQQHERHTHYFPAHDRPLYIMEQQEHMKPLPGQPVISQPRPFQSDTAQSREKSFGKNSPRSEMMPEYRSPVTSSQAPKENEIEIASSKVSSSRTDQPPLSLNLTGPHHGSDTVITSACQTARSSNGSEKDEEMDGTKDGKQREHQIMWTRKMFEQKRRIRQEEIEWQHRQQQMRQQKREVQQELYQFRQKLLQQKESELEDGSKKEDETRREKKNGTSSPLLDDKVQKDQTRVTTSDGVIFPLSYTGYCQDNPGGTGVLQHTSTAMSFRQPQHDVFYPTPNYLPPVPSQAGRMDTRMYRDYLQQSPHHYVNNKTVNDWLEKQKQVSEHDIPVERSFTDHNIMDRFGRSTGLILANGNVNNEKYSHEPRKLKFMKDLGLMTVSDKKERPSIFVNGKRKLDDDVVDESNKENRIENGENIKTTVKELEQDDTEKYSEKVDFLYNLGLVTHQKRQELEDDFEKNRWERRVKRFQKRTKRTKKQKKEEKERSKTPALDVCGPITRQKQQLLQEYGLILPIDKASSSSPDSTKSEAKEKEDTETKVKKSKKVDNGSDTKDVPASRSNRTSNNSPSRQPAKKPGPQLTLQSITHMENPYGFPSAFRPPFYRPPVLTTAMQDKDGAYPKPGGFIDASAMPRRSQFDDPKTTERQSSSVQVTSTTQDSYSCPTSEPRPQSVTSNDIPKWPGTTNVIRSYLAHHNEQENEMSSLKERSEKLKLENDRLNQESEQVNSTFSALTLSKRKLDEDHRELSNKLGRMHDFVIYVQNR